MEDFNSNLNQTRESLEFALESGKMSTWDIDLETNEVSCSSRMLELWNVDIHDFNNQRSALQSKVHPEDLDRMNDEINHAISNRTIYELEYRIIPRPGDIRWVFSRGRCTFDPGSDRPIRLAGIVYDITDKKIKEIELAREQKLRSDFLLVAGHELKTPLTCLQLQLKTMEWQLKEISILESSKDFISKGLKKQQNHLTRISKIVDNLLDEAKITEGLFSLKLEQCELTKIVLQTIDEVKLLAESNGIEIKHNLSQLVSGMWDRFRLEQVVLNLLSNAIRYSNNKPIHIEVIKKNDHAVVIVKDEGIGIRPEDQFRVFQRFERLNPEEGIRGMGLGLYISKYIVQSHGGEIRLKSDPGKGSEFSVYIPCN